MDHHFGILQQRIQPSAIRLGHQVRAACARGGHRPDHAEGAGHEIIQDQEKYLYAGQHYANVRHQFGMLAAVKEQHKKSVDRKQPAPEEQRTLLPRPQ